MRKNSILIPLLLLVLISILGILVISSAQTTQTLTNVNERIALMGTESLVYYNLIYNNEYLQFFQNITANLHTIAYVNSTVQTNIINYSANLYSIYENKTYIIPLNGTSVLSESVSKYNDQVLLAFIGIKGFKIEGASSAILYYSVFNGTNWSFPIALTNSGYSVSVYTNGTYILDLWKPLSNSSNLYLLVFKDLKLIANYTLSPNITSGEIITFNSNLVAITNFTTFIPTGSSFLNSIGENLDNFTVYIFSLDSGKVITKTGGFSFVEPVYNSSKYFIAVKVMREANLLFPSVTSYVELYDINGTLIHSWKIGAQVVSAFMEYPNIIGIEYLGLNSFQLIPYVAIQIQIFKNNTWYNYTEIPIKIINNAFPSNSSSPLTLLNLGYFEGVFRDLNKIALENVTILNDVVTSNSSWTTLNSIIIMSPYSNTLYFSTPPKPILNVTSVNNQGYTLLDIHYAENNYSEYGIEGINVYVNGTLIQKSDTPSGYVIYNVTGNGTYMISVVANNLFGNSTTVEMVKVYVQPAPVVTIINTSTSTLISTSTFTSTSSTSTSGSPQSSSITSQSTSATETGGLSIIDYIAIGVIAIVIILVLILVFSRRK